MQYKYKCFWIEVVDLIEYGEYDNVNDPQGLWRYSIYYNGICCTTETRATYASASDAAEYWVKEYGFEWLGVE